ncbi:rho GTPase-activating protein 12-like isoform X6 [Girardinichthys multiradiatus]|uniref:rho GTPase-activating protein 12-like isoform X6 n=1 Tax=Girardinichthys multiradiatus TaxID=208333 RepID=UPI001FAC67A6|nr:rho GTPase-activating protein 12-like isoform X6 [Girardinichthys multiradiatus]
MAELHIAPGQVYIEVVYDYEYKSKDRFITIREGECYMLVKKTNEDWWQVRKDEATKPFYVPAQYVREVRKALMPPPKPISHSHAASGNSNPQSGASLWVKPTNLDLGLNNRPLEPLQTHESKTRRSPSAQTASSAHFSPPIHRSNSNHHQPPSTPTERSAPQDSQKGRSSTLPRTRAQSPDLGRAPLDVDVTHHCDSAGEEKRTNGSESGEELSSSSTELLQTVPTSGQGRSESPVYANLQELKITKSNPPPLPSSVPLHVIGDWETYKDQFGRHYYCNRSTQERTWKPPRTKDAVSGNSREDRHSAGESSEYNLSPPQLVGDGQKSRSLDRKNVEPIVLTKWRHSAYVQEPSEKRLVKSRRVRSSSVRQHPYKQQETPQIPKSSPHDSDLSPTSPKPPASPSEKCGPLNVTKITEHGKRVRKNWMSSWTVLKGSTLLFAKGQGGGTSWFGGGQSKPEFTVDLRGGSVDWAPKEKSSKKHVLELKIRQGMELLLWSEDDGVVNEWFKALQDSISAHAWESDEAIEEDMPESPGAEKHDKEKEQRQSKKDKAMKPSASVEPTDNKKTRHKLKKFLTRRPTLQAVRDRGYIKDQVFGCSLSNLCQQENTTVPTFVKTCIDHVENNGLNIDGLYRVSGNLAVIQKLRFAINHDEKVNLSDTKWEDIHVTTGALKMFFRELPEPLFTYALFNDFVSAIKIQDHKQRVQAIKELVRQLPRPNHDTMQGLFKHLRKVIDHGEENRMTTQGVAIVFGPTLLRPETETLNMAFNMVYQNQIVELILLEYENIFGR